MPSLSVVVIGRNEGPRLERCLHSILEMEKPDGDVELIYVDSASADDSISIATRMGGRVISVSAERPTAALARNAGWRASSAPFVLFLDGDTVLHPSFIKHSLPDFKDGVAIVFGSRREIHPEASAFNRVLDLDWILPAGAADFCGGDALVIREALEAVQGYDETLIAGEEPEMCRRLRAMGFKIQHADRPMTGHDLAMTKWSQYWRRAKRTGYAYAEVSERFRGSRLPFWEYEARHNRNRALVLLSSLAIALVASAALLSIWPLALLGLGILVLALRTAQKIAWKSPIFFTRFLYGMHSHLQQIPIFLGQREYRSNRRNGRVRGLIEYKGASQ